MIGERKDDHVILREWCMCVNKSMNLCVYIYVWWLVQI